MSVPMRTTPTSSKAWKDYLGRIAGVERSKPVCLDFGPVGAIVVPQKKAKQRNEEE